VVSGVGWKIVKRRVKIGKRFGKLLHRRIECGRRDVFRRRRVDRASRIGHVVVELGESLTSLSMGTDIRIEIGVRVQRLSSVLSYEWAG
jgi:hypothetical protein